MPANSKDSKNYAHLLSNTRQQGQAQVAAYFYLCVHTIGDETPLVTAGQAAGRRCVKPRLASAERAVLSIDTNPPPSGGQWQGGTCPEP